MSRGERYESLGSAETGNNRNSQASYFSLKKVANFFKNPLTNYQKCGIIKPQKRKEGIKNGN